MNNYRFGYVDLGTGFSRVFECKAKELNEAFYYFGTEMDSLYGVPGHEKVILVEVRENGISIDWM